MSKDFVWHEADAEHIRHDCEKALLEQIDNMRATEQVYRGWLPMLDAHAREQEIIAATAMRTVSTRNGGTRQVPDWPRREEAARRANSLREQIGLTGRAISDINLAVQGLNDAIAETNRHFWRMRNEAQATDRDFSRHMQIIDGDIATFISKMQETNNSISEDGFTEHQRLAAINRMASLGKALKASKAFGEIVGAFPALNIHIGRALTPRVWQAKPMFNQLGGFNPTAHLESSAITVNSSNNTLGKFGRMAGRLGHLATPVDITVRSLEHYERHGNEGRATSYGFFVGGGSSLIGYFAGKKAAPYVAAGTTAVLTYFKVGAGAVAVGTLGAPIVVGCLIVVGAGAVLYVAYDRIPVVRLIVDSFGDSLNVLNGTSQSSNLESDFWTPEILSWYNDGSVGQASSRNDWTNGWSLESNSRNLE